MAKNPLDFLDVERVLGSVAEPGENRPVTQAVGDPSQQDPMIGQEVCGYRVLAPLGSGSHADVYLGRHTFLDTGCAVKVLRSEFSSMPNVRRRFLREAQAISKLVHPNVVELRAYGELDGRLCIILELVDGRTLKEIVETEAPLAEPRIRQLGGQIASALAAIHARDSIHRDVKPGNIMVVQREGIELVKLLDLGLVRYLERDDLTRLTSTGYVLGTPAFMAPEQKDGSEVGPAADCYALGLVLYNMATGALFRSGSSLEATGSLRPIIERLIADDPQERPSARDVIGSLRPRGRGLSSFWLQVGAVMLAIAFTVMAVTVLTLDRSSPAVFVVEPASPPPAPPPPKVVAEPRPEEIRPPRDSVPARKRIEKKKRTVEPPRPPLAEARIARALERRGLRREDVRNLERAADPVAAIESLEIDAAMLNARLDRILGKLRRLGEVDPIQVQALEPRYLQLRKAAAREQSPRPERMMEAEDLERRIDRALRE